MIPSFPAPGVIGLVLLAALLHASWNALIKSAGQDRTLIFAMITAGGGLLALPFALASGFPARPSWPWLGASVLAHYVYFALLLAAYRYGELSRVYPLARGIAPLLVALGGWFVAAENIGPGGMLAVGLVSLGVCTLAFEDGIPRGKDRAAVLFALLCGVSIALYTVLDAMGVRAIAEPLPYIAWLFVLEALPFAFWLVLRRADAVRSYIHRHYLRWLFGSFANVMAYGLVIYALSNSGMAAVSALRETSTLLAAVIGTLFLGDKFGRRRILAATCVAGGVALLKLLGA